MGDGALDFGTGHSNELNLCHRPSDISEHKESPPSWSLWESISMDLLVHLDCKKQAPIQTKSLFPFGNPNQSYKSYERMGTSTSLTVQSCH
uniref:Uncharacterized protein n=1 Tax=Brassica oleracea TaxID=3712 RepID=A0A3P6ESN9_BRAOL|nr:unnamed protein product [Brassica oleracea]